MDHKILEFIKEDIRELKDDLKDLKKDVTELLQFKWQIVGGTILGSLIITGIFQFIITILSK